MIRPSIIQKTFLNISMLLIILALSFHADANNPSGIKLTQNPNLKYTSYSPNPTDKVINREQSAHTKHGSR